MNAPPELKVLRAAHIVEAAPDRPCWLIESLWGAAAVGVIGGAPKSCKTWLALEMAVAVASGRPALGRFPVPRPAPVLFYAAEDTPLQVKKRIQDLARARAADFQTLDIRLVLESSLRLDRYDHLDRLRRTLARHRPGLLVLDPYVRLQRVDENDATQVSAILATLRELSRAFHLALVLVHHARKNGGDFSGQNLRGSSDFHAWGDSNLYLARRGDGLILSAEHRAAAGPPPLALKLATDPLRLDVQDLPVTADEVPLADRLLEYLRAQRRPCHPEDIRDALRVRNQSVIDTLRDLQALGLVARSPEGWRAA